MRRVIGVIILILSFESLAAEFSVTSQAFKAGQTVPEANQFQGFGCSGKNQSPDLKWKSAPKGTQSFAVTVYDPDAPTGSGWWHWTLFNLPASVTHLAENASGNRTLLPKEAVEGRTDFGKAGYGGPCPPVGDKPHKYIVTVYALKTPHLDLNTESSGAMVGFFLNQNVLAKAQLTVQLGR